ncbi:PDZ domain-containing protein [Streptomyces sp. NPDC059917]|uniref:S41 family peptidase n=1 Tax=Streptomyces sp. NPDC059917 TaxID=3347002 RepID=UPI00364B3F7B
MPTAASHRPYAAHPHLHEDLLVFTADRDVWTAPVGGGEARRFTDDGAPAAHPRISPDGTLLAWTSHRDGAPEAYVAPLAGGPPRRLTHFGHARTRVAGWTPQGEVLVLSAQHTHSPLATWAWAVAVDGGAPRRLPYGPVGDLAPGPDGAVLVRSVTMFPQAAYWKRYRGGAVGRLWLAREDGRTDPPTFARFAPAGHDERAADLECPLWLGGPGPGGAPTPDARIGYLSDAGGRARLWSSAPDGSDPRPHTPDGAHPGFAARNATTDGTRVVYQSGGDLWLVADTAPGTEPVRVDLRLPGVRRGRAPYRVRGADWTGDFGAAHTGVGCLLEIRGTVHLWPGHEGPDAGSGGAVVLSARPGVRCRMPRALGESGGVGWVSDVDGADALEVLDAGAVSDLVAPTLGSGRAGCPPRVLASGRLGRVLEWQAAPDGRTAAVAAHDGRVLVVDLPTGRVTEVDRSVHEEVTGLAFSPDSRWLGWSHPGPEGLRQIRLARVGGGGPVVEATCGRFRDESPAFTPDGAHLAFVSDRVFDPEYQTHVLDLAFLAAKRPHLLTLRADSPSPLLEPGPGTAPAAATTTTVETEGLSERIVPFPVEAAEYGHLTAAGACLLWIRTPLTGTLGDRWAGSAVAPPRPRIESWDLATGTLGTVREGVDAYEVSGAGRHVLVRDGAELVLRALDAVPRAAAGRPLAEGGPPTDDLGAGDGGRERAVPLAPIAVTVDPAAEWAQAFAEDERLMRDNVWRPDLPQLDGDGPWARYRPLLDRIGCAGEFTDLLWDVHGDLGWSHAYVWPRADPGAGAGRGRPGLLGADLVRSADGAWRIARIVPGESSVPAARSPLAAPGTGIRAGDALVAVDGRPVDPAAGPAPDLWGTAGRAVELTVRPAAGGADRRVTVVPLASETALRHQDLIRGRRDRVRERSAGRLGYLHVPDMVASGWAQLHRDLRAEAGADGLLVDFRGNSGGHLSALVLERIARRPVGWQLRRGGRPESYPALAARGPLVFLADELSGSDGDNVVAAVRAGALGPVIGVRTWGGVRGMEVAHGLVDGTRLVHPRGAFWFAHGGWDLENRGVEPDLEVVLAPHHRAAGEDPQLDAAIAVALDALAVTPPLRAPAPPARPGAPLHRPVSSTDIRQTPPSAVTR